MILGLDLSTSICGYTILNLDGSLNEIGHIELKKIKDGIWVKVDKMKEFIRSLKGRGITQVFIEEALSKFRRGKSNAATISLLLRFNGICSYIVYQELGVDPVYYSATSARKLCNLTIVSKKKSGGLSQKEQAFRQMCQREPFKDKEMPKKRTGKIKDHCYDEVDSYVVAYAGFVDKGKSLKIKLAKKKAKKKTIKKKKVSKSTNNKKTNN